MRCLGVLAISSWLVACTDGSARIGAQPDAAVVVQTDGPPDAFVQSDGPGYATGLEVTAPQDLAWSALGRGIVGALLVQALSEPNVREVLSGLEPTGLAQPRQRPCYLITRNDVIDGRPAVALDFMHATQECLVKQGVFLVQAPMAVGQPAQITLAAMPYVHGRRIDGAFRITKTDDPMRFRVATGDPVLDPPVQFQDTCDGESGTRCLRICDPAGVCIRAGWTGLATASEEPPKSVLSLDGTGAVAGLIGGQAVDNIGVKTTAAGSSSTEILSCEHDAPTWSPGALRFETTDAGPTCACPLGGTERLAGTMEFLVRKPCGGGTALSFSLVTQGALVRTVYGDSSCGNVSFSAACAPGTLDVPSQSAMGCTNECVALGCAWSTANGTCTCAGGSVPRGMRQAIFDLEPLLPAAFAEGQRAGCAAPAP